MDTLKAIWKWLSGKKSAIGSTFGAIAMWALAKGWIDQTDATMIASFLTVWTCVAVVHKMTKGGGQ
jgi:hypothetical protein